MNVRNEMANEFRRAVNDPENINEDGSINWDFVEADVFIEVVRDGAYDSLGSIQEFFDTFNELVDLHLATEAA